MSYPAALGTMLGLVIGDAFGAPFEGSPVIPSKPLKYSMIQRKNQYFTDDTRQALAVAESLVICRGFDGYDLIKRLIEGYRIQPEVYGPTSKLLFQKVAAGIDPFTAAEMIFVEKKGGRSNGAVMRGPPVGILYTGPILTETSTICAALTHWDPVTIACSVWVNQMVSDLCRGMNKEYSFLHARALCREPEVLGRLGSYGKFPVLPFLDALPATHAALSLFMESPSFGETILRAISSGGDSDTVAAIAGALAGAYYGVEGVPKGWVECIHDYHKIINLSASLWAISNL